jgi:hypothetical protein
MLCTYVALGYNDSSMTHLDPANPERFKSIPYPSPENPELVYKIFDDPDFIQLNLREKKTFDIRWASNASHVQSLELLGELIEQSEFKTGTLALRHTFRRPGTVSGGANMFDGEAEDILNEVRDAGDRVISYTLKSKSLELNFSPSWPKTYHDIQTNEVFLRMKRSNRMARYITDQAISLTAMEGLRSSTDQTLDEFSEYLPSLKA